MFTDNRSPSIPSPAPVSTVSTENLTGVTGDGSHTFQTNCQDPNSHAELDTAQAPSAKGSLTPGSSMWPATQPYQESKHTSVSLFSSSRKQSNKDGRGALESAEHRKSHTAQTTQQALSHNPKMPFEAIQQYAGSETPPFRNIKESSALTIVQLETNQVHIVSENTAVTADKHQQKATCASVDYFEMTMKTPRDVQDGLKAKMLQGITSKDARGKIYVFRDLSRPQLGIKIGKTKRANHARLEEHQEECGIKLDLLHQSFFDVEYRGRVEDLIHLDLVNYNRHWRCFHKGSWVTHKEWFIVSPELAIQTVNKWEAFMRHEKPYSSTKHLSSVWVYLIDKKRAENLCDGALTHETRFEQLDAILAPATKGDYVHAYWQVTKSVLQRLYQPVPALFLYVHTFFWQLISLFYSIYMLVLCRNTFALFTFLFVLFCAGISMRPHLKPSPPKKTSKSM